MLCAAFAGRRVCSSTWQQIPQVERVQAKLGLERPRLAADVEHVIDIAALQQVDADERGAGLRIN
jgi:hypothetical protein